MNEKSRGLSWLFFFMSNQNIQEESLFNPLMVTVVHSHVRAQILFGSLVIALLALLTSGCGESDETAEVGS